MRTFDDLSHVLLIDDLFELHCSCQKLSKMAKNGPKFTKMDQNGLKWTNIDQNGLKWTNMTQYDNVWLFCAIFDDFSFFFYNFGCFCAFWDHLGQNWTIWDIFPQLHKSSYKLTKHDSDHQMSACMVQENHQEKISTQLNQCEILVFFGTIYGSNFPGGIFFQNVSFFSQV